VATNSLLHRPSTQGPPLASTTLDGLPAADDKLVGDSTKSACSAPLPVLVPCLAMMHIHIPAGMWMCDGALTLPDNHKQGSHVFSCCRHQN
jgi:hypothetical protein